MTFPTLAVTSPHKKGQPVQDAQWLLKHNRFGVAYYKGEIDGDYGPLVGAATHRAKYWLGYPTKYINTSFGDKLYSYLLPLKHDKAVKLPVSYQLRRKARVMASQKPKPTLGERRFKEALKWEYYREKYNNLTIFGEWFGANGNPWCAYFVSYCDDKAGGKFHFGYVPYIVAAARAGRENLFVTSEPKTGDFVCFDWERSGWEYDHIGLFDKWINREAGTFKTIEGNTLPPGGSGNQSNGGGVYRRERSTKSAKVVFVREHGK